MHATMVRNFSNSKTITDPVWIMRRCVPLLTVCTVSLCPVPCALSHISDHDGVFGLCCVTVLHAVPHCSTMFYCAVLIPCCAVYVYLCHAGGGGW